MDARTILENVHEVSARFATERSERQQRRELVCGLRATPRSRISPHRGSSRPRRHLGERAPIDASSANSSARWRTGSSVALVCAMHPTVLVFWLANAQVPAPFQAAWEAQRRRIFQTVCEGAWWGTIASEPGSGATSPRPKPSPVWADGWGLPADRPEGVWERIGDDLLHVDHRHAGREPAPDVFFLDMRNVVWDGTAG